MNKDLFLLKKLGYEYQGEDDFGMPVYSKNGLKWIFEYLDLVDNLQQKQEEVLSFEDMEFIYGYHIDDYFFYNNQGDFPEILSIERKIKWLEAGLVKIVNCIHEPISVQNLRDISCEYYCMFYKNGNEITLVLSDSIEDYDLYNGLCNKHQDLILSTQNACHQGYKWSKNENEYFPFMFRERDKSKWIHFIDRLANSLSIDQNNYSELEAMGYNVYDYYKYNKK